MGRLDRYRSIRDFAATPEPAGDDEAVSEGAPRFVVQEHHATSLHWDLRLERDGVLVSWAVPKGLPADPRENNLAVHTEDHPLSYLDFAGEIPEGSYGAGTMTIWDEGTYESHKFEPREVMVTLRGRRVRGRYVLFQTGGKNWMVHRMDPPEDRTRQPMPTGLRPMLAMPGRMPAHDDGWGFEVRWEGLRALVGCEGGRARAQLAGGDDLTPWFPEVRDLGRALGSLAVLLDGKLVVLGEGGRPDAEAARRRTEAGSESRSRRLARQAPAVYMVFDLLWLEGHPTMALPYEERRRLLDDIGLRGGSWQVPRHHVGEGRELLAATRDQGLGGVVAKRLDSPYEPGKRSRAWRDVLAATPGGRGEAGERGAGPV